MTLERTIVEVPGVPRSPLHQAPAVKFDGFTFVSGIAAADYESGLAEDARPVPGLPFHDPPARLQSKYIYDQLAKVITACGASLHDTIAIHQFFTDKRHFEPYRQVGREVWGQDRPPSTALPCAELAVPGSVVEIDVTLLTNEGHDPEMVSTSSSPQPLGSFVQGIRAGDWIVLSGATPTDYERMSAPYPGALGTAVAPSARVDPNLWYGSEIQQQVEYIMFDRQLAVLEAAGSSLEQVVKAEVYLSHMEEDFAGFQDAWRKVFPQRPPATTIVPVEGFGSTGSRVEIGLVALAADSRLSIESVSTPNALPALGHAPQAVRAGSLLFLSTVIAADQEGPAKGASPNPGMPLASNQTALEMEVCLSSAASICEAAGSSLDMMLKRRNFYLHLTDLFATEWVVREAWPDEPPASTNLGVSGPLPVPRCNVAMDMVCGIPEAGTQ